MVLWNGSIWQSLDAPDRGPTVALLARRRAGVRLLFMGSASDHPAAAASVREARELAQELGVLGSTVISTMAGSPTTSALTGWRRPAAPCRVRVIIWKRAFVSNATP